MLSEEGTEKTENTKSIVSIGKSTLISGLLVVMVAISVLNLLLTINLSNSLSNQLNQQQNLISGLTTLSGSADGSTTGTPTSSDADSPEDIIAQIAAEVLPVGVPDIYGEELGISFDSADTDVRTLADLERSISFDSLTETQKQRYGEIATTEYTACEYCCGVGSKGFGTVEGKVICGCAHNLGFSGLTKYLLQNHEDEYTNEEIINEVQKWKAVFFPKQTIVKEVQLRADAGEISQSSLALLPDMVGGC